MGSGVGVHGTVCMVAGRVRRVFETCPAGLNLFLNHGPDPRAAYLLPDFVERLVPRVNQRHPVAARPRLPATGWSHRLARRDGWVARRHPRARYDGAHRGHPAPRPEPSPGFPALIGRRCSEVRVNPNQWPAINVYINLYVNWLQSRKIWRSTSCQPLKTQQAPA